MRQQRFLIVIENAGRNLSAYAPDLPGCVTTGSDREEVLRNMREAIELHLEGIGPSGIPRADREAAAEYVTVSL